MHYRDYLLVLALLVSGITFGESKKTAGLPRTILFVDDEDVLYRSGTMKRPVVLEKPSIEPIIAPEKPWEGMIGWTSCYRDQSTGLYQMWYQAYQPKRTEDKRLRCVVCYAESDDGFRWRKPNLGLFKYYEFSDTNIVLIGAGDEKGGYGDRYCNSVVVDRNAADPGQRYKMLYYDWRVGEESHLGAGTHAAFSADGKIWKKYEGGMVAKTAYGGKGLQPPFSDEGIYVETSLKNGTVKKSWPIPFSMSDAMDVFFDSQKKTFVAYGKLWIPGPDGSMAWKHAMGRIESQDFLHWGKPELVAMTNDRDPPQIEFHTSPVFQYNQQYLSINQILDRSAGTIDAELMSSRDGFHWDRSFANQWILPRGPAGRFDSGSILTNGTPIILDNEVRFYYGAYRGSAVGGGELDRQTIGGKEYFSGIGLATTKRDRFVAVEPNPKSPVIGRKKNAQPIDNTIGQVTLRPISFRDVHSITVNANASQGSVRIEILNEDGFRLRGFSKDDAIALQTDGLALKARWNDKQLSDLPDGRYLIRVHLDQSSLFALTLQ